MPRMHMHVVPAVGVQRGGPAGAFGHETGRDRDAARSRVGGGVLQLQPMEAGGERPVGDDVDRPGRDSRATGLGRDPVGATVLAQGRR